MQKDLLGIEKSLEDPKTLTISGFLDKSVRRRKSAGISLLYVVGKPQRYNF